MKAVAVKLRGVWACRRRGLACCSRLRVAASCGDGLRAVLEYTPGSARV